MNDWIDKGDAKAMAKVAVVLLTGSSVVLTVATTLGLAVRFFHMAAGG